MPLFDWNHVESVTFLILWWIQVVISYETSFPAKVDVFCCLTMRGNQGTWEKPPVRPGESSQGDWTMPHWLGATVLSTELADAIQLKLGSIQQTNKFWGKKKWNISSILWMQKNTDYENIYH